VPQSVYTARSISENHLKGIKIFLKDADLKMMAEQTMIYEEINNLCAK
jgi:hypothetical protein